MSRDVGARLNGALDHSSARQWVSSNQDNETLLGSEQAAAPSFGSKAPSPQTAAYTEAKFLWMTRLADALMPMCFAVATLLIYDPFTAFHEDGRFYVLLVAAVFLTVVMFRYLDLYTIAALANLRLQVRRIVVGWTAVALLLMLAVFAVRASLPLFGAWAVAWYVTTLCGFVASRGIVYKVLRFWVESDRLVRDVAVVGDGAQAERVIEYLNRPGSGCRVVGVFGDGEARSNLGEVAGVAVKGTIDDLLAYSVDHPLDHLVIALPWAAEQRITNAMARLSTLSVDIGLVPDLDGLALDRGHVGKVGNLSVLNVFKKPLSEGKLLVKRIEDVTIAVTLLILLSPVMLGTAALIKLTSRGPVLFRQMRFGLNNQLISVWKFRTMYIEDCTDVIENQTLRNDPRVTSIGRLLRKTSIDELPQLINVLQGRMSVVGPRPHAVGTRAGSVLFEDAVREYLARHRVKPGVTGWAQVNGWRGETDTLEKIQGRVDCDLYYIENWSLLFDIKIVLMTAVVIVRGRNAW